MPRILGLDPGTVRVGTAVSDVNASLAFPRPAFSNDEWLLEKVTNFVLEETVGTVVVGRPVALSGKETESTKLADRFYDDLSRVLNVDVVQWDERLTTTEASRSLREAGVKAADQRSRLDSAAAVIMLQSYLDAHHVS